MSLKCKIGLHNWKLNCEKCDWCGKIRENHHDWKGCKCEKCEKTRDEKHNWNGCKCEKCGKYRDEQHNWNGCKCLNCNKTRDEQHDYSKDCEKCSICNETIRYQHDWSKNMQLCQICGKNRNIDIFKYDKVKSFLNSIEVIDQESWQSLKEIRYYDIYMDLTYNFHGANNLMIQKDTYEDPGMSVYQAIEKIYPTIEPDSKTTFNPKYDYPCKCGLITRIYYKDGSGKGVRHIIIRRSEDRFVFHDVCDDYKSRITWKNPWYNL
jgi:hypothetical protein